MLLVSGEPHPGERTWRNLLKADASVDLVHFTILRPPEKQDGTPIKELVARSPSRPANSSSRSSTNSISSSSTAISARRVLPLAYLANVADYVKRGGAVLIAAGPDFAASDGL